MEKPAERRSTIRDLLTVLSGTAGAQAIGVLILPVLSRTFAPEAFGVFQLYLSLLIFCTVGIALRIELTLLSKAEQETPATLASLFMLVTIVSLILATIATLYDVLGPGLGFPAPFLALGLIGSGFAQIASYKLIRDQNFARLAMTKVLQVVVYAVVAFAIAMTRPTPWGIIAADVTGRIAAGAFGFYVVRHRDIESRVRTRLRQLPGFVCGHWELVVISLPGALANSAGAMLTPFMIFQIFGAAAAGQFGLIDRSMGVPVAMIVNAGSQVFVGRLTALLREQRHQEALYMFLKLIIVGGLVCGTGAAILYLLLPLGFETIFGPGWEPAIRIAQIMVFAYAVLLVVGIVNQTLVAMGAFKSQAAWDFCGLLCIGAAWIAVAIAELDLYTAVLLHSVSIILTKLVFITVCITRLRDNAKQFQGKYL